MNLNKVFLIGRLTKDPETRTTPNGQTVCSFGLATNRVWTNQATRERKEQTEYHNIVLWRRLAEIAAQYLNKGSLVLIEGRIQTNSWQDQTGNKRYKTEIVADNIQLGPRSGFSRNEFQNGSGQKGIQTSSFQTENKSPKEQITTEEIPIIEEGSSLPDVKKDSKSSSAENEENSAAKNENPDSTAAAEKNQSPTRAINDQEEEIDVKNIPF